MKENFFYTENRPWGTFTNILTKINYKVKEITVNPKQRLSYQSHNKRAEQWIIVEGTATVTLEDVEYELEPGQSIQIPLKAKHRIENKKETQLKFIEVQTGEYFGEDDIIRYNDDYGRN